MNRNTEDHKMNSSYIELGLSGLVLLGVLASALHYSDEEQIQAMTQHKSQNNSQSQTPPEQTLPFTVKPDSQQ